MLPKGSSAIFPEKKPSAVLGDEYVVGEEHAKEDNVVKINKQMATNKTPKATSIPLPVSDSRDLFKHSKAFFDLFLLSNFIRGT